MARPQSQILLMQLSRLLILLREPRFDDILRPRDPDVCSGVTLCQYLRLVADDVGLRSVYLARLDLGSVRLMCGHRNGLRSLRNLFFALDVAQQVTMGSSL